MKCEHPDHEDGKSCAENTVGCHTECFCCMGEMAVFNYLALIGTEVSDKARLSNAIGGLTKLIDELAELRELKDSVSEFKDLIRKTNEHELWDKFCFNK